MKYFSATVESMAQWNQKVLTIARKTKLNKDQTGAPLAYFHVEYILFVILHFKHNL